MIDIYVAASSGEIERAKLWMQRLRDAGFSVTSTWPEVISASGGDPNPRGAADADRLCWSLDDLRQVKVASVLWMLVPTPTGGSGRGAYVELGYAQALNKTLVISGDTKQSIFCALGTEFAEDIDAFTHIVKHASEGMVRIERAREAPRP
jgi:hypothetical protein